MAKDKDDVVFFRNDFNNNGVKRATIDDEVMITKKVPP